MFKKLMKQLKHLSQGSSGRRHSRYRKRSSDDRYRYHRGSSSDRKYGYRRGSSSSNHRFRQSPMSGSKRYKNRKRYSSS
ncbi:hypothetical protein [Oceanobacillus rekensis]|uniref:hypothetical protein n=1 Tax=Oceanobacillus rekensis TaxID=937927 RepID=UPI0015949D9B|nr:hypothetical protein [Oceanobacillus rekensis]